MVFKIPASAGHLKKNRFEFELGDETLSIPKTGFMPPAGEEFIAENNSRRLTRREQLIGLIEAIEPEVGKKVREARLSRDQIEALEDGWYEASKVTPGESSASESS